MNTTIPLVLLAFGFIAIIYFFARRKTEWPLGQPCSVCGAESEYGYDKQAEDLEHIKPMCLKCLEAQLEKDYQAFTGRAVVIQPAEGPPSYVFQPAKEWIESFKDTKIGTDVRSLLADLESKCHDCGQNAQYLWVESSGLNGDNFSETLDKGILETLRRRNPKPVSMCPLAQGFREFRKATDQVARELQGDDDDDDPHAA